MHRNMNIKKTSKDFVIKEHHSAKRKSTLTTYRNIKGTRNNIPEHKEHLNNIPERKEHP